MRQYPHMCRSDHIEIGHSDSEHEQCPLCRAIAALGPFAEAADEMEKTSSEFARASGTVIASARWQDCKLARDVLRDLQKQTT